MIARILIALLILPAATSAQTAPIWPGVRAPIFGVPVASSGVTSGGVVTAPQLLLPDGTVALPGLAFASDPNTGWYWTSDGVWLLAINGTLTHQFGNTYYANSSNSACMQFGAAGDATICRAVGPVWNHAISGTDKLSVSSTAVTSTVPLAVTAGTKTAPGIYGVGDPTTGLSGAGTGFATLVYGYSSAAKFSVSGAGASVALASDFALGWQSGTDVLVGGQDTILSRGAANRLDLASGDSFNIVDGNLTVGGTILAVSQALSGAGAVNVTALSTNYTSTGALQALTLANGTAGQLKTIIHVVDGGSGVLTPTTPLGYGTITFTNAGDAVTLQYTAQGWVIIGWNGVTIV